MDNTTPQSEPFDLQIKPQQETAPAAGSDVPPVPPVEPAPTPVEPVSQEIPPPPPVASSFNGDTAENAETYVPTVEQPTETVETLPPEPSKFKKLLLPLIIVGLLLVVGRGYYVYSAYFSGNTTEKTDTSLSNPNTLETSTTDESVVNLDEVSSEPLDSMEKVVDEFEDIYVNTEEPSTKPIIEEQPVTTSVPRQKVPR